MIVIRKQGTVGKTTRYAQNWELGAQNLNDFRKTFNFLNTASPEDSKSDHQMPDDVVVEDYLSNFKHKTSKRRRTDPLVALTTFFEKVTSSVSTLYVR